MSCNVITAPKTHFSMFIKQKRIADPHHSHRKVSFRSEPLWEMVEGVWLGADWVAVPMDLVEQVG